MGQLADWKCHKVVKAGKILTMPQYGYIVTIEDCNQAECKVDMPADAFKRGRPAVGDYIVIYDDEYKSWSPAKAFEDGYTRQSSADHQRELDGAASLMAGDYDTII